MLLEAARSSSFHVAPLSTEANEPVGPVAIHRSFISIDIGRERKTALPLQKIENVALAFERHAPGAVMVNGRHAAVPVFAKADRRTF